MNDFPGWTYDPARREYYYYSAAENCWIYQSGARIVPPQGHARTQADDDPGIPRTDKKNRKRSERNVKEILSKAGESSSDEENEENISSTLQSVHITEKPKERKRDRKRGRTGNKDKHRDRDKDHGKDKGKAAKVWIQGPDETVTDPELLKVGVRAQGLLKGGYAPSNYLKLNPEFKTRKPGRKFFVRGKVFKALWPETLGETNESVTTTRDSKFGEEIATKIRWFVVVKEGPNFCTCLPIVTYNRRGVAKPGVVKSTHAIAFQTASEPLAEPSEMPRVGEYPMLPGIQIRPTSRRDKLDPMARIDFARMYTVEHNIKAYDFGDVEPAYMERLIQQWVRMIAREVTDGLVGAEKIRTRLPVRDDDDNDDEGDEDNDDEDDNDNDNDDEDDDEDDSSDNVGDDPAQAGSSSYVYGSGAGSGSGSGYTASGYTTSGYAHGGGSSAQGGYAGTGQYSSDSYAGGQYNPSPYAGTNTDYPSNQQSGDRYQPNPYDPYQPSSKGDRSGRYKGGKGGSSGGRKGGW